MADRSIVGTLTRARVLEMLDRAQPNHPMLAAKMARIESPVDSMAASGRHAPFQGSRATAESGAAWTVDTVADALLAVGDSVAASGLGEEHFVTVQNLEPSVAQSALTELAIEKGWAKQGPDGVVEWVKFGQLDAAWIEALLERIKAFFGGRASRPALPAGADPLPNRCKVLLVGDWGTGLYGAPAFKKWAVENGPFDVVIHLGDTYYAGTKKEVRDRLQGLWPLPSSSQTSTISRFLNGNHEMYAGGKPYFKFLKAFQQMRPQTSSFFALQNDHWLILGLDTSWHGFKVEPMMHSGHLAANQRQWLIDMVKGAQGRRVILLSHHQPFHFTKSENSELTTGLQPVWDTGNVDFWFWGHQHAGVRYDQSPFGFRGRCVGHGGIPELRPTEVRTSGVSRPTGHADYAWKGITTPVASHDVQAWIIDGPNPLVSQDPDFSPHGWAVLELDAESATERWYVASDDSFEVTLP